MATTVPIVGNRRENPSVYLRPIAQATSHRPATSRNSQAMGDPPKNVRSSQFLSTLFAVGAARPRKKNRAATKYELKESRLFRGRRDFSFCSYNASSPPAWTPDPQHPEPKRPVRKRG